MESTYARRPRKLGALPGNAIRYGKEVSVFSTIFPPRLIDYGCQIARSGDHASGLREQDVLQRVLPISHVGSAARWFNLVG